MMDNEQTLADIRARIEVYYSDHKRYVELSNKPYRECTQAENVEGLELEASLGRRHYEVRTAETLLQIIDQQQAENQQLKHRLEQEWDALYSVLPDPDNAKVSAKGAVVLVCERLKAQQAVIDAAQAMDAAYVQGADVWGAWKALHDALDELDT